MGVEEVLEQEAPEGEYVDCPECAEPIRARARSCRFCGFDVQGGRRPAQREAPSLHRASPRSAMRDAQHVVLHVPKSPGVAVLLSFFWSGLGQLYAGAIGKGLAIMVAPLVAVVVLFVVPMFGAHESRAGLEREVNTSAFAGMGLLLVVAGVCFWAWQLFDAYATANAANRSAFGGGRSLRRRRR